MKKIIITTCIIGMMLVFSGISISATTSKNLTYNSMSQKINDCPINITVHEAWDMLTDTGNGVQIPIDVRREDEWNTGFIDTPWPECPRWYTKDLFYNETWLAIFLEMYAGEELVIYCKGGYRSYLVSIILCNASFTGTVYNMLGGITDWVAQEYPIRNNTQPEAPTINGPKTVKKRQQIDYNLSATDPEDDAIYFWVDWCGEGHCGKWQGPYASGEEVTLNHTWSKKGNYTIKAKVKDFYGNESDWTEFEITVPRNKDFVNNYLEKLYMRFPFVYRILKYIFGL